MQMPCAEGSQRAAARICSQVVEVGDALQQHMLPCLGLRSFMQLAGTCREWRQLVIKTPLQQLSGEVRRAVLPSGLTSSLLLPQLVKQQAQLLARLRGKQGFTPGIQHLSLKDELQDGSHAANAQQRRFVPRFKFSDVIWSPCTCLEHPSQWLALQPFPPQKHLARAPILVDFKSGQQVCFDRGPSMWPAPNSVISLHTAWLTDESDGILTSVSDGDSGSIAFLADVDSRTICPLILRDPPHGCTSQFFRACSVERSPVGILCWVREFQYEPGKDLEAQISAFDVSSRQLLYQLGCPQQLHQQILQLQNKSSSRDEPGSSLDLPANVRLDTRQLHLAPSKELLAVVWECYGIRETAVEWDRLLGLSIHSAIDRDFRHSVLLPKRGSFDSLPSWLPDSSNLMYVTDCGSFHVVTSSGCIVWSSARASRNPFLSAAPDGPTIDTDVSASPCGRWILVMDVVAPKQSDQEERRMFTWQFTLLEASTGQSLFESNCRNCMKSTESKWSTSGQICLLAALSLVLVSNPSADSTFQAFQQYELLGRSPDNPEYSSKYLSLSPCGSTVVGLELKIPGLEHWQIPHGSSIVKEASSAPKTLLPVRLAGVTPLQQGTHANIFLHEAWHPVQRACIYAILSKDGSVHLIDAKANRCIRSWSHHELHDPATPLYVDAGEGPNRCEREDDWVTRVLSWSEDGCRLAIATGKSLARATGRSGIKQISPASCCVLHF